MEVAEEWLKSEQDALKSLLQILCLRGGVSFQSWQYLGIQIDLSDNVEHNVWILADGTVIVTHSKLKQHHQTHTPMLLGFSHKIH